MTKTLTTRPLIVICVLLATSGLLLAQVPLRPGRWELSLQMQMPDMPVSMPAVKMTQCVTPDDLKEPAKVLPRALPDEDPRCQVSDYKVDGNKVTWKIACKGDKPLTGQGELVSATDSYEGWMKVKTGEGDFTMKYSAKRVGDCTK